MEPFITLEDLAVQLRTQVWDWTDEELNYANSTLLVASALVANACIAFEEENPPYAIKAATTLLAARLFNDRNDNLSQMRIGDYSESYLQSSNSSELLSVIERKLLAPFLKPTVTSVPLVSGDSPYWSVPVAGSDRPFPWGN